MRASSGGGCCCRRRSRGSDTDTDADAGADADANADATPLFLVWAMHLVHMPLQVPQAYLDRFAFVDDKHRRSMHAMVSYLDEGVGNVTATLKSEGMWNNTLVVFHADNGEIMGAGVCGGNNWPLRGGKVSGAACHPAALRCASLCLAVLFLCFECCVVPPRARSDVILIGACLPDLIPGTEMPRVRYGTVDRIPG